MSSILNMDEEDFEHTSVANVYIGERVGFGPLMNCWLVDSGCETKCRVVSAEQRLSFIKSEAPVVRALQTLPQRGIASISHGIEDPETNSLIVVYDNCGLSMHNFLLASKALGEHDAKRCFSDLIAGLRFCHNSDYVLRDLKIEDICFDAKQKGAKIVNMKSTLKLDGPCQMLYDRVCGPAYLSPEMLGAGPYSGKAADVWALGIVFYTLLVGRYPFSGETPEELFVKIAESPVVFPPGVSSEAKNLIRLMLCKCPEKRPTVDDILSHNWFKHLMPRVQVQEDQTVPVFVPCS
eukprot:Nk52_evm29s1967 gene=Nk52_evmTU29s1967